MITITKSMRIATNISSAIYSGSLPVFGHVKNPPINGRKLDLIISNLDPSNSQGLETLITISEKVPEVPVVALTGDDDEKLAVGALQSGAQDYLRKGQPIGLSGDGR